MSLNFDMCRVGNCCIKTLLRRMHGFRTVRHSPLVRLEMLSGVPQKNKFYLNVENCAPKRQIRRLFISSIKQTLSSYIYSFYAVIIDMYNFTPCWYMYTNYGKLLNLSTKCAKNFLLFLKGAASHKFWNRNFSNSKNFVNSLLIK